MELAEVLRAVPGVDQVTPAGSLRRGRETVGDLDLLVTGPDAAASWASVRPSSDAIGTVVPWLLRPSVSRR